MGTILTDEGGNKVKTCESKLGECVGIPGASVLDRGKDRNDVELTWENTLRACKIESVCALSHVRCRKFFVLEAVSGVPRGPEM